MLQNQSSWRLPQLWRTNTEKRKAAEADKKIRKRLVSEKLWPSTLDHESFKASLILRSFCQDGLLKDDSPKLSSDSGSSAPQIPKTVKIPPEIVRSAKGLIVCSIMRAGLWESGAGGSGVAVARLEDGSWSCPAAIEVKTAEIGVVIGVDLFDCVLVLNTAKGVESIKNGRCFIGGDLYAVPGPFDISWFLNSDACSTSAPVFSYLQSQRYFADASLDNSTFINERLQENEDFYSPQKIAALDILNGKVTYPPISLAGFRETLKVAQGDEDANPKLVPAGPPPSDFKVVEEGHTFGLPDIEDPDPYGALALEKHGFALRDAQTKKTATLEHFDFNPSVTSPVHERYFRKGGDSSSIGGCRSSWRASTFGGLDRFDSASTLSIRTGPTSPPASSAGLPSPGLKKYETIDEHEPTIQHAPEGLFSSRRQLIDDQSIRSDEDFQVANDGKAAATNSQPASAFTDEETNLNVEGEVDGLSHSLTRKLQNKIDLVDSEEKLDEIPTLTEITGDKNRRISNGSDPVEYDDHGYDKEGPPEDDNESHSDEIDSDQFEDPDEEFEVFDGNQTFIGSATLAVSRPQVVQVKSMPPPPMLPARSDARSNTTTGTYSASTSDTGDARVEEIAPWKVAVDTRAQSQALTPKFDGHEEDINESVSPLTPTRRREEEEEEQQQQQRARSISPMGSLEDDGPARAVKDLIKENKPVLPHASLLNFRNGLKRSPSPEVSPEERETYFR